MLKDQTLIVSIIDRSTSMGSIKEETVAGFNKFLKDQQALEGDAVMYNVLFDGAWIGNPKDFYAVINDFTPVQDVEPLDYDSYVPQGCTALYDAVGITIDSIGKKLASRAESDRPNKVMVVIITDGEENSSKEYSYEVLHDKIKKQQDTFSWEFLFLGANIDAKSVAKNIGIKADNAYNYNATRKGITSTFSAMSEDTTMYRSIGARLDPSEMQAKIDKED